MTSSVTDATKYSAIESIASELSLTSIWKLSVEQYHQMIVTGTLGEDDPVELLEGWLVTKMPKYPPHTYATEESAELIRDVLPHGYFVRRQDPITTTDSEPEPGISIIKGSRQDYKLRHPTLNEIVLVIEVADSTLRRDRTVKQRIYAVASIPVYWLLNLSEKQLEVYTKPSPSEKRYDEKTIYSLEDFVPLMIEGKEVAQLAVKNLLP
jgi:Putative restriction endonuclease